MYIANIATANGPLYISAAIHSILMKFRVLRQILILTKMTFLQNFAAALLCWTRLRRAARWPI